MRHFPSSGVLKRRLMSDRRYLLKTASTLKWACNYSLQLCCEIQGYSPKPLERAQTVFGFGVVIEPEHSTPSGHCLVSKRRKVEAEEDPGVDDVDNMEIFKHLSLMCGLYLLQQTQFLEKPGKLSIQFSLLRRENESRMRAEEILGMYLCCIFKRE